MEATFVKDLPSSRTGAAQKLYALSEPYEVKDWDGNVEHVVSHVVVSAAVAMYTGAETYVFPANADGEVVDWAELDGSIRGGLDHEAAIDGFVASVEVASR